MKITYKEIKAAFLSRLLSGASEGSPPCPSQDTLESFFERRTSRRNKRRIVDHVAHCPSCYEYFVWLLALDRNIRKTSEDIKNVVESSPKKRAAKSSPFLLALKPLTLLIGVGFLGAALFFLIPSFDSPRESSERAREHGQKRLSEFYPSPNAEIARQNLRFQWKSDIAYENFEVEVFDSALALFWKSSRSAATSVVPSMDVIKRIRKAEDYFWLVTAITRNGALVESPLMTFRIAD